MQSSYKTSQWPRSAECNHLKKQICANYAEKTLTQYSAVVPKQGVNYPLGVICDSFGGNVEPKPQCCSIL